MFFQAAVVVGLVIRGFMLDIGAVLATTFRVWFRKLIPFFLIALFVNAPMVLLRFYLFGPRILTEDDLVSFGFVSIVYSLFATPFVTGTYTFAVIQELRGAPASISRSLNVGMASLLPVLILTVLASIALTLGVILLIIPALILATMWCVIIPVCVAERQPIFDCFSRSARLTSGSRWAILGLLFVVIIIWFIPTFGIAVVSLSGVEGFQEGDALHFFTSFGIGLLSGSFWGVLATVIYHALRELKEGVTPDEIAQIFE